MKDAQPLHVDQESQQGFVDLVDDDLDSVIACSVAFILEKRECRSGVSTVILCNPFSSSLGHMEIPKRYSSQLAASSSTYWQTSMAVTA